MVNEAGWGASPGPGGGAGLRGSVRALRVSALAAALLAAGPVPAWAGGPAARAQGVPHQLVASGCSVSNLGYLSELAAEYERRTGIRMFVRGGGSVVGLDDLISGKVDFAASCRGREPGDPAGIDYVQVAWDALVFVVHPSNPVRTISLGEARRIYLGRLRDWGELPGGAPGPITVLLQRPSTGLSGVEHCVRMQVLDGGVPVPGPGAIELASSGIVEQLVEKTPGAFGATGFSSARRREVRMLALDGVEPTRETIASRAYPLLRPLFLMVREHPSADVAAFLEFALGEEGQRLISSFGAVSLRDVR